MIKASRNAGLPDTVPAMGVNMVCGSGLRAVALAAQVIFFIFILFSNVGSGLGWMFIVYPEPKI